jgi:hypothetical protein
VLDELLIQPPRAKSAAARRVDADLELEDRHAAGEPLARRQPAMTL